jgi:chemotaxis protein MotA
MFSAVFSGSASREQLSSAARTWELTGAFALAMGAIGTIIGLVIMLKNMDDPAAIGPGMAIGILTLLYGLILAFAIALPVSYRLEDRAAASPGD